MKSHIKAVSLGVVVALTALSAVAVDDDVEVDRGGDEEIDWGFDGQFQPVDTSSEGNIPHQIYSPLDTPKRKQRYTNPSTKKRPPNPFIFSLINKNRPLALIKAEFENERTSLEARRKTTKRTPLIVAAVVGRKDIVKYLLSRGADPLATGGKDHKTARELILEGKTRGRPSTQRNIAKMLEDAEEPELLPEDLEQGSSEEATSQDDEIQPVMEDESTVEQKRQEKLNQRLLRAAGKCGYKIVEDLIEQGASVHAKNCNGRTPLHIAANAAKSYTVILLLNKGASPLVEDNGDKTPLQLAQESESKSKNVRAGIIAELENAEKEALCSPGPEQEPLPRKSLTELNKKLLKAVRTPREEDVASLIKEGASVHARNNYDRTPLHIAAAKARLDIVDLLLKAGADPFATTIIKGIEKTPRDLVNGSKLGTDETRKKIAKLLEDAEAELSVQETELETLHLELSEEELTRVDEALLRHQAEAEMDLEALGLMIQEDLGQEGLNIDPQAVFELPPPPATLHLELSPEELERMLQLQHRSPRPENEPPPKRFRGNGPLEVEEVETPEIEPLFASDSELLNFLNGDDDDDGEEPEAEEGESMRIYRFTGPFVRAAINGVGAALLYQQEKSKH